MNVEKRAIRKIGMFAMLHYRQKGEFGERISQIKETTKTKTWTQSGQDMFEAYNVDQEARVEDMFKGIMNDMAGEVNCYRG